MTWRHVALPRVLNDSSVQEKLAAVIATRIPELPPRGSGGWTGSGRGESLAAAVAAGADESPAGAPRHPLDPASVASGLDVDAVMQSLFENDEDGTLEQILGPLLGTGFDAGGTPGERAGGRNADWKARPNGNRSEFGSKRRLDLDGDEDALGGKRTRSREGIITEVPAHVRGLDVAAFVKSIEY